MCIRAPALIFNWFLRAGAGLVIGLWISLVAQASIVSGPYVLLEHATVLRIRFEVDRPDYTVTLLHGPDERAAVLPTYSRGPRDTFLGDVTVHLSPNRPFRGYEIGRSGETANGYEWRSRIDGRLQGYPKLIVYGDSQGGPATLARLAGQWRTEDFDLVVGLGDLADAGSRYESWSEEFFVPLRAVLPHYPFLAICGNHDSYREKSLAWFDWYFGRADGRRYARMDFGDLRLIALNNSDLHTKYGFDPINPLTPQYDFLLESALGAAAGGKTIAIFCHVPIVSGSTVVNTEFGSALQRKYILPILERAPVLGFFAGHHHKFERVSLPTIHGGMQHIVTGGGGGRLFTASRQRGGFPMNKEVFETYHYLAVNFAGDGAVVARALGGAEIDRVTFNPAAKHGDVTSTRRLEFWRADLASDLLFTPSTRVGCALTFTPGRAVESGQPASAKIHRTERGLVAVARNLSATSADVISFQGYDWPRKAWSYLQGGSLVMPVQGFYATLALVSLNGADVAPLDRILPVLHWPVAGLRAGLVENAGAAMLLRGRRDFEMAPEPQRLVAKWQWGKQDLDSISDVQRLRQWWLMDASPAPMQPEPITVAELIRAVVAEGQPDAYILRADDGQTSAMLLHWRAWHFFAVVLGNSLTNSAGSIFVSAAAETGITIEEADGIQTMVITRPGAETLRVPLAQPGDA